MAKVDLQKLKEQALKAVEKQQHAKAGELYAEIARHEAAPDWRQRAGESLRKAGDAAGAIAQLTAAAEGYAKGGFLLKAIAVCKVVLQIDARHTATQAMLAELYAQRDHGTRTSAGDVALVAPVPLQRTSSGGFAIISPNAPPRDEAPSVIVPPAPAVPVAASPSAPAPSTQAPARLDRADDLLTLDAVALDELPRASRTLPPGAPMDVLPLATVLGGTKSGQFALVDLAAATNDATPTAYEIELGDEDVELADAAAEAASADEHITLSVEDPAPAAKDDLDFSGLLDDEAPQAKPAQTPPAPAAPPPRLPRIPLFSSLPPERLVRLIERMALRTVEAGATIVRQGERSGSLFVIVRGRVQVVDDGPPPRVMAHLDEGAFFGEPALLSDSPRSATVAAEEPTELLEISREVVSEIVADSPDVLRTLLRFFRDRMLDRLIGTSPLFSSLSKDDAQQVVARFKFLELEPGVRLVREGERAPGLFLLLCGEVEVARAGRAVVRLGPGELFGERSLLTRAPANANIDTRGKAWALELSRGDFQEIMMTYPQLLEYVSELSARREAASDGKIDLV